jgi:hypothetical protein
LGLAFVRDFRAQNCQYTTKVDARQNVQLTTSPAIEPNACYAIALLFLSSVLLSFRVGFVVLWLGGSFSKLGFSVGLCGFANVPPNALVIFGL